MEKGAAYGPPAQYGGYPGQQYNQQPMYSQPVQQYQPPFQQQQQPMPVQQQENKQSRFSEFGKNYGKTFVNATAW